MKVLSQEEQAFRDGDDR